MRLIDADELHESFDNALRNIGMTTMSKAVIHSVIENTPTVDPVRHGYWEEDDRFAKCSECKCYAFILLGGGLALSDFCPNCGADMRGDNDATD